jgi:hypothetical protein
LVDRGDLLTEMTPRDEMETARTVARWVYEPGPVGTLPPVLAEVNE